MTTTNGTMAITKTKEANLLIIGAFLNISEVRRLLSQQNRNVLITCAGWKGKVNLEDTLFAGALVDRLKDYFEPACDAALVAHAVYKQSQGDYFKSLAHSSHVNRLTNLGIETDIRFCLQEDVFNIIPVLKDDKLVKL
jgi:2-phosphosulfolactate phosphatase